MRTSVDTGRGRRRRGVRAGFSLAEVVLAMGVVGLAVSAVLGVLAAGRGMERRGREDALAARFVPQLQAELALPGGWNGETEAVGGSSPEATMERLLEEVQPLDSRGFGSADAPLVLGFDGAGRGVQGVAAGDWESGTSREEVQALVGVWGRSNERGVMEVEVSVEFPARAKRENRRRYQYRLWANPGGDALGAGTGLAQAGPETGTFPGR